MVVRRCIHGDIFTPDFHRSKNEGKEENMILKRSSKAAKSSENIEVKNVPQEQEISLEQQESSEIQIIPVDQDSVKKQKNPLVSYSEVKEISNNLESKKTQMIIPQKEDIMDINCCFCLAKFLNLDSLIEHTKTIHGEEKRLSDVIQNLSLKKSMEEQNLKDGNKKYACAFCNEVFLSMIALTQHYNGSHESNFQPQKDIENAESALISQTYEKLNGSGKFPCQYCKIDFDGQNIRAMHVISSHPTEFQQSIQFKAKKSEEILQKNEKTKFQCTSLNCNDWFVSTSQLKSHILCVHEAQRDKKRLENSEDKGNNYITISTFMSVNPWTSGLPPTGRIAS